MTTKAASVILKRVCNRGGKDRSNKDVNDDFYWLDYSENPKCPKKKLKDKEYYVTRIGMPEADAKRLANIKRWVRRLDGKSTFRPGLGGLIGLIPAGGDAIDALLALLIVRSASKVSNGLDPNIRRQMMANVALDFFIGLVPVLGDFADIILGCNTRNSNLLEEMLVKRVNKALNEAEKNRRHGCKTVDYPQEDVSYRRRLNRPETAKSSSQGSARQDSAPEPMRSQRGNWNTLFGRSGGPKESGHGSGDIVAEPSMRHDNARDNGSRFVSATDI